MFVTGLLRRSSLTHDLHTFVMRSLIRKKNEGGKRVEWKSEREEEKYSRAASSEERQLIMLRLCCASRLREHI